MTPAKAGLQLIVEGSEDLELFVPMGGQFVVGSDPRRAGLLLTADGVAAEHFSIGRLVKGGWAIRDLGSEVGTNINGQRVKSKRIQHGDRIEIGELALRIVDSSIEVLPAPSTSEPTPANPVSEPDEIVLEPAPKARPSANTVPKQIGGYRIEKMLGRGAFGNVLLAVQESLQRETALKLLSPALAENRSFVARFKEEARAAASLAHPNVVIVYDVGEAQGYHFLSMEYMSRGSLEGLLKREGKLAWNDVLPIIIDATRGLVYAEQRGIVHRDIKPANLMQTDGGVTKISDLGLAVSLHAATNNEALGTAHFVSPEQARGEQVDHRSDLYSLGATAFQLLTGRTPFEGKTKSAILKAVFHTEAPSVSEFEPNVPAGFSELIARLLAKSPDDRPGTARQLLFELDQLAARSAHSPVDDQEPHSSGVAVKLIITLLVVAGLAFAATQLGGLSESNESDELSSTFKENSNSAPPEFETTDPAENLDRFGVVDDAAKDQSQADDLALISLERQANDALQKVAELTNLEARVAGLKSVQSQFGGTNAAIEAGRQLTEIDRLAAQLESETHRQVNERNAAVLVLKSFVQSDGQNSSTVTNLLRIRQYQRPLQYQNDELFGEQLLELEKVLVQSALGEVEVCLTQTDQYLETGHFELAASALQACRDRLGVSSYQSLVAGAETQPANSTLDPTAPHVVELLDAHRKLVERSSKFADEQKNWGAKLQQRDLETRRSGILAGVGLETELIGLDFAAARTRLLSLGEQLQTMERQAEIFGLLSDLERFASALQSLGAEFTAGHWRRTTVSDPRRATTKKREVIGVENSGWLLANEGRPELVPHSAFMRSTSVLERLFNARLDRDYTEDELLGIAFGLHLAAVLETLEQLGPIFESSAPSLQSKHMDDFLAPFAIAENWAVTAGAPEAVRLEQVAVRRVVASLIDAGNGAWTSAINELDSANEQTGNSLLLLLMP
ncbi:MAG: serine/threonine protein kinase [Planctomycetota bacterium]|jgi:serine/threonine protein kinase